MSSVGRGLATLLCSRAASQPKGTPGFRLLVFEPVCARACAYPNRGGRRSGARNESTLEARGSITSHLRRFALHLTIDLISRFFDFWREERRLNLGGETAAGEAVEGDFPATAILPGSEQCGVCGGTGNSMRGRLLFALF